jgi:hypothetical protein
MLKEAFQQWDMFTGQPVTVYGRSDQQPLRQMNLFSVNEIVQLGVHARPWLKDMPVPSLTLECQDTRTEEEKERDLQRTAEALMQPMFVEQSPTPTDESKQTILKDDPIAVAWVSKHSLALCRPDLAERIQAFNEGDMTLIAQRVQEALDKTYQMVLDVALIAYLGLGETLDE